MKRIVSMMVIFTLLLGGMTHVQAQTSKAAEKAEKKQERKEKTMVQIASNSPYPGPNGLGGITVQGSASNVQVKQENNGNVYLSMSVQGIFISATVNLVLYSGTNNAMVTVDPNFSGNNLTMNGTLLPYSDSNVFQGTTY